MSFEHTAIIVEPRKHKALFFVLENFLTNLDSTWKILLLHGSNNEEYCQDVKELLEIKGILQSDRLFLENLHIDNLNQKTYSELLAHPSFFDRIDTKYFLIFQTDSIIFSKYKHLINMFIKMDVDYVGAPWLQCEYLPTKERKFIGNGGCSLRKTETMRKIAETYPWNSEHEWHEDLFFTKPYPDIPCIKPPYHLAKLFCVDEIFSEVAFSCHRPWSHSHFKTLTELYPDVKILHKLQDS